MNKIETALTSLGITYADPENDILSILVNRFFNSTMDMRGIEITVPANTLHNYHLFVPPDNLCILRVKNASWQRLYDDELTYAVSSTYANATVPDSTEQYEVYRHGNGILFDTEDDAYTATLECLVVDKTSANLDHEMRTNIMCAYYMLYTGNIEGTYNYIKKISITQKNIIAQNTHKLKTRAATTGQIVPLVL